MDYPTTASGQRALGGLKWTQHGPEVLGAWVAEMDYGLAEPIARALVDAVERADTGYAYPAAEEAMSEAAAGFWKERHGWGVDAERVFPAPDVVEGIRRTIVHLTEPGSSVVLHSPIYYPFFSMVERAGRSLIEVRCPPSEHGRYHLDIDGIDRALAGGAGCLILCNPWNPTGRSFTEDELREVISVAASHEARVIADEIHGQLTYSGGQHVVAASLDPRTVITVTSASKAWNLPGLKCAQVVLTNDEDVAVWSDYFTPEKVGVSTFGLIANTAAFTDGAPWLDETLGILEANRSLLDDLVATHLSEATYHRPEATFLAWLDFSSYGIDDPATHFLERARVALTSGSPFGTGGVRHARLNFATSPEVLTEIVRRLGDAV